MEWAKALLCWLSFLTTQPRLLLSYCLARACSLVNQSSVFPVILPPFLCLVHHSFPHLHLGSHSLLFWSMDALALRLFSFSWFTLTFERCCWCVLVTAVDKYAASGSEISTCTTSTSTTELGSCIHFCCELLIIHSLHSCLVDSVFGLTNCKTNELIHRIIDWLTWCSPFYLCDFAIWLGLLLLLFPWLFMEGNGYSWGSLSIIIHDERCVPDEVPNWSKMALASRLPL